MLIALLSTSPFFHHLFLLLFHSFLRLLLLLLLLLFFFFFFFHLLEFRNPTYEDAGLPALPEYDDNLPSVMQHDYMPVPGESGDYEAVDDQSKPEYMPVADLTPKHTPK